MKPKPECASCLLKWLAERIATQDRDSTCFEMIRSVSKLLHDEFYEAANLGSLANGSIHIAGQLIDNAAGYFEKIKRGNNQLAQRTLPFARDFLEQGNTPNEAFERACSLAAAANVSPIGVPSQPSSFEELESMLKGQSPMPSVLGNIYEAAERASRTMYITDNSGEIGFDLLVLEKLKAMGAKITLVVKEGSFFEDATEEDVLFFGLDKLVDQVLAVRGFFVPYDCSPPLIDAYNKSDLVICKGTGNFEGLESETFGKATIFMLKLKCGVIAEKMGMEVGDFVVKLEE